MLPPFSRTLDVLVFRVRKALKLSPGHGAVLRVVHGHGYRLDLIPLPCR
ncbi:hypothetical protein CBM2615_B150105 [Cupriavidus taiwanensis]|uniref:OmpR/PhoB-type domain-containing protein n=1 Tax=Cupriavidus taiwanensis TaxID=164546 RepID=A0A375E7Z9_9BURK|nr:hypothetical protein CBM2614_B160108 [Cupriavidus taiwanensis]SOZ65128.1 hypothetical protein CBM2615_B150105 [Cupriavidus taiwanensis]SOZ68799.1 hypothetical protein CBM2613_B120105 [Cupriavidus taiwanensis]SPA08225.1 hypothetical protein CBM2625_B120104 [Cupriavidus taiwanensis]